MGRPLKIKFQIHKMLVSTIQMEMAHLVVSYTLVRLVVTLTFRQHLFQQLHVVLKLAQWQKLKVISYVKKAQPST